MQPGQPTQLASRSRQRRLVAISAFAALALFTSFTAAWCASRYTPKQIETFASYVGKNYWVVGEDDKTPAFLSSPSPTAPAFRPAVKEGFALKEIVGKETSSPYYRAAFESGKEGFIPVVAFLEQLNGSFVSIDPDREAKAKTAKEAEAERKRREWIRAQRWPEHFKEAALNRQPALGMNKKEARTVLGRPKSVVPLKSGNALTGRQEQWIYENGPVLTFKNGLITRIQPLESKTE